VRNQPERERSKSKKVVASTLPKEFNAMPNHAKFRQKLRLK